MKKNVYKLLSLLLTLMLALQVTTPALAVVSDTIGNTNEKNQGILNMLEELTGGDAEAAARLLNQYGLLDENGDLKLSECVTLDGKEMTLAQVKTLLNDPSTDLGRIANVDGSPVAMGDLKTMLQIEEELARIKSTYFSGQPFSEESQPYLNSLLGQLENEGISLNDAVVEPAAVKISTSSLNFTANVGQDITLSLTKALRNATTLSYVIESPEAGTGSYFYSTGSKTITIPKDQPNWTTTITVNFMPVANSFTLSDNSVETAKKIDTLLCRGNVIITAPKEVPLKDANGKILSRSATVSLSGKGDTGFSWKSVKDGLNSAPSTPYTLKKVNGMDNNGGGAFFPLLQPDGNNTAAENSFFNGLTMLDTAQVTANVEAQVALFMDQDGSIEGIHRDLGAVFNGKYTLYRNQPYVLSETAKSISIDGTSIALVGDNNLPLISHTSKAEYDKANSPYWHTLKITSNPGKRGLALVSLISLPQAPRYTDLNNDSVVARLVYEGYPDSNLLSGRALLDMTGMTKSVKYTVTDTTPPTVTSIKALTSRTSCSTGDKILIAVNFNEPVIASSVTMTVSGKTLTSVSNDASAKDGISAGKQLLFEYVVAAADTTKLTVSKVEGATDLFGNKMTLPYTPNPSLDLGVALKSVLMADAVKSIKTQKTSLKPGDQTNGFTMTLELDQSAEYLNKYKSYYTGLAPFVVKTDIINGVDESSSFLLTENGDTVTAVCTVVGKDWLPFDRWGSEITFKIWAYEMEGSTWGSAVYNTGMTIILPIEKMVYVDGLSITASDPKTELSLTDSDLPKLGVQFKDVGGTQPTYKTGTWTSSDANIATVEGSYNEAGNPVGTINPTGAKLGTVKFTFKADDNNVKDTNISHVKSATSVEYKVTSGAEAGIVVPKGGNQIVAIKGQSAQLRWYGNLKQYLNPENSDHVKYTVDIFSGHIKPDGTFENPVHTSSALAIDTTSYDIPVDLLTTLSQGGTPVYTARISAPHPTKALADNGVKIDAYAYIIVNPVPIRARLSPPKNLYMLDTQPDFTVNWAVENYDPAANPQTFLTVERVGADGTAVELLNKEIAGRDGKETVSLQSVADPEKNLRELYVVTLKVKNQDDENWATDSYQFYVYNSNALDIVVGKDGAKQDSITLSNRDKAGMDLPQDTGEILKLREMLGLSELVGINYKDYNWSTLKDGIKWSTGDKSKVSLNYRQGALYEDVDHFGFDSYIPQTQLAVAGLGETDKTTITATHANTGMATSIDVKVESLQNKLYFFHITPMQETTLTYTNGDGVLQTVKTNSEGMLVLYEPKGIASPVYCKAQNEADTWLGTIAKESLRSGEGNALLLEMYPVNALTLKQVAKTEFYLKKEDGTPYVGSVTLRGGVYKNDGYCQDARFGVNGGELKDGTTDQTVTTDADGKIIIGMDVSQFWSSEKGETPDAVQDMSAKDKLQYIFEISKLGKNGTEFYPALVYVDGVKAPLLSLCSGQSVYTLEKAAKVEPFLAEQRAVENNGIIRQVRNTASCVGPNETTPTGATLESTVMLWGVDGKNLTDYNVTMYDEFGSKPAAQVNDNFTYPFSSIPVARNVLTLSPKTLTESGWVPEGRQRGIKFQITYQGKLQKEMPLSITVADLSNAPKLEGEAATNILLEMKTTSGVGTQPTMDANGDKTLNKALEMMGDMGGPVDSSNFKMVISPGEDAATFKAYIWAGYNSLGIDDAEYGEDGVYVQPHLLEDNSDEMLNLGTNKGAELAGGIQKAAETGRELAQTGKSSSGSASMGGQLEGYYEALIRFNFDKQKWELFTLGGGFTVGFGVSFEKSINQMVGPVPITASFGLGAAVQLDFKLAARYRTLSTGKDWSDPNAKSVNDFLTTLRIHAYFEAFGGFGFDLSIIALKIGVFGRVTLDNSNAFLSRPYLKDESQQQTNGQVVKLTGEVGIKFVAKFLFIEYEAILASVEGGWQKSFNDWQKIQDYWKNTGSGLEGQQAALALYGARSGMDMISSTARMESRDYLEDFSRSWGMDRRARKIEVEGENRLKNLQTNAYPFALPQVTDDGEYLLYVSDMNSTDVTETRVFATAKGEQGFYAEGTAIASPQDFDGFGDSGLRMAGNEDFAAATWVRQSAGVEASAGDELDYDAQAVLTNATEIVASVKTKNGAWTSTRLSDNGTPDLAPVVATNGSKAIVAWRSVYAGNSVNPMDFTTQDNIVCKIYDNGNWGDPIVVYPGTSGAVKGIEVAMLPDGTAAVTYTLDRISTAPAAKAASGGSDTTHYETVCTIVNPATGADAATVGRTLMLTSDSFLDENPQIAAVDFGTNDNRFVVAWHSVHSGVSDIRMAALNKEGPPDANFPESISQVTQTVAVSNNFRFVATDSLKNLSLLWSASGQTEDGSDILWALKFLPGENGSVGFSAPLNVAKMPKNTVADHFDAYVNNPTTNEIKAVIQGTEYLEVDPNNPDTYERVETDGAGNKVYVPKDKTVLYTATETYKNSLTLVSTWADFQNLAPKSLTPVRFTITNSGYSTLDSVTADLAGTETVFADLNLAPAEKTILTCYHAIGEKIEDVNYTLTPTFDGTAAEALSGTVYLNYPDVGIAKMDTLAETDGRRDLRVTLYNGSQSKLENSGSTVKLALYDNADYAGDPVIESVVVSDATSLAMIDNGALCVDLSFDLDKYLTDNNLKDDKGEIPDTGMRLYAKAWVEKGADPVVPGEALYANASPEVNQKNNESSIQLDSLFYRAGEPVTITTEQSLNGKGNTVAAVTVRNNSLINTATGNLVVSLLDDKGAVLETQQSYTGNKARGVAANGLITLAGEESAPVTFTFEQAGGSVDVKFGELVLGNAANAALTTLSASNVPVRLSDFVQDDSGKYTAAASTTAQQTRVIAIPQDPDATVKVNGNAVGLEGVVLPLTGKAITVEVTAKDGETKQVYELVTSGVYTITLNAQGGSGSPATVFTGPGGKLASLPAAPTRTDYTFDGWFTEASGGTQVTLDTVFSQNTTIFAHWTTTGGGTPPVNPSLPGISYPVEPAQPGNYQSDTTKDLNVKSAYQFKITSADKSIPDFTVGTPGVFLVSWTQQGGDYFFKLHAIGKPGQKAGIYLNGKKLLVATVEETSTVLPSGMYPDTFGGLNVKQGQAYQFKITSGKKPVLTAGSASFRVEFVTQTGNDYFFKVYAIGKKEDGCGFYLEDSKTPFSIGTIV